MSEREAIEREAEQRGWSCRRGGSWTSLARNEFRLAIDWNDTWQATAAELSIAGGTGVARRSWRSSSVTPGLWALNLIRGPLISRPEPATSPEPVGQTQEFAFAVAAALIATAVELRRLALMLNRASPAARSQLHTEVRKYTIELDSGIRHLYLDTPAASAVTRLRDTLEESQR